MFSLPADFSRDETASPRAGTTSAMEFRFSGKSPLNEQKRVLLLLSLRHLPLSTTKVIRRLKCLTFLCKSLVSADTSGHFFLIFFFNFFAWKLESTHNDFAKHGKTQHHARHRGWRLPSQHSPFGCSVCSPSAQDHAGPSPKLALTAEGRAQWLWMTSPVAHKGLADLPFQLPDPQQCILNWP